MDEMIELILEILFKPFEAIYERTFERIKHIPHKGLRIFVRIILIAIPVSLALGLYWLLSRLFSNN
jgi:hypothetical protein